MKKETDLPSLHAVQIPAGKTAAFLCLERTCRKEVLPRDRSVQFAGNMIEKIVRKDR